MTALQQTILDTIHRLSTEGPRPRPPTVRELARVLGRAPSTIVGHLYRLERLGRIVRDGTARGLWVVITAVEAPGELDRARPVVDGQRDVL